MSEPDVAIAADQGLPTAMYTVDLEAAPVTYEFLPSPSSSSVVYHPMYDSASPSNQTAEHAKLDPFPSDNGPVIVPYELSLDYYEEQQPPQPRPRNQLHRPYFVGLVFVANVVIFIVEMWKNDWKFESTDINPMYGPSTSTLISLGAKQTALIREGQYERLIAPMFLHAGLIHLAVNMLTLLRLGRDLEEAFGPWRVGLIYLLSGLFGVVLSAIFLPAQIGIGASGALYGLVGALLGDFFHNMKDMQGKWSYLFQIVLSSLIGLAIGLMPLMDNFMHVGGWLCGLLMSSFMFYRQSTRHARAHPISPAPPSHARTSSMASSSSSSSSASVSSSSSSGVLLSSSPSTSVWGYLMRYGAALILVLLYATALIVLFTGVDGHKWCSFCSYISCVPTPWWDCEQDQV